MKRVATTILHHRLCHGFFIHHALLTIQIIAMQQKDGVVHGYGQLQRARHGLCNKGYAAQGQVGSHVEQYAHTDGEQKEERL